MGKEIISNKYTIADKMTLQESEANKEIRLRGLVRPFVQHLQTYRSGSYDTIRALFYRAFDPNEPETELLSIVRGMAVQYLSTSNVHGIIMAAAPQMSGAVMSSHA